MVYNISLLTGNIERVGLLGELIIFDEDMTSGCGVSLSSEVVIRYVVMGQFGCVDKYSLKIKAPLGSPIVIF